MAAAVNGFIHLPSPERTFACTPNRQMLTLLRDLRYALRSLRKMPGFTIVALLVLALGIGANTAIFSVVNSVVLRPLPYPGSDRLALIWETDLKDGIRREGPSGPNFLDWKEQSRSFEDMAILEVGTGTVTGEGEPEQVVGLRVTTNFLSMLGARTVLGRDFTAAEGAGQARYPVAVLTNGFWKRRFGADPRVIGRTFTMNSEPYTVIGVLAPDFYHLLPTDLYVPWPVAQLRAKSRVDHDFGVIARLKPGVSFAQAQSELSAIARRIDAQTPRLAGWDVAVVAMKQALFEYIRPALLLLLGAVGLLLLLACVNVASLLLARVTGRHKEMAIRAALGARRGRLIAQILSESLLLSLLGGALGVFFAAWGVELLSAALPATLPMAEAGAEIVRPAIGVDGRALLFALAISTGAALIFGLIPALYVARADVNDALKAGGRTSSPSPGRTRGVEFPGGWGGGSRQYAADRRRTRHEELRESATRESGHTARSCPDVSHAPAHRQSLQERSRAGRLLPARARQSGTDPRHSVRRSYRRASARTAKRPGVLHHRKSPHAAGADRWWPTFAASARGISTRWGSRCCGEGCFPITTSRRPAGDPDRRNSGAPILAQRESARASACGCGANAGKWWASSARCITMDWKNSRSPPSTRPMSRCRTRLWRWRCARRSRRRRW